MQLFDLKKNKDERLFNLLKTEIDKFLVTDHLLKNNYKNLIDEIDNYLCFNLLIDDGQVVAFSGLYNNLQFPKNIARALNRLYYAKDYRTNCLFPRSTSHRAYSSKYMLPYQVSVAREHGLDGIFVSVENYNRRNKFFKLMELSNKNTGLNFKNLPHMYYTCPKIDHQENAHISCWQNVSWLDLTGNSNFDLPKISIEQWIEIYGNNTYYKN
jgi:hypothetical protein